MDELKVNWDDNICKLIHKKSLWKIYHNDIKYHMTLHTILSVRLMSLKWLVFLIGMWFGEDQRANIIKTHFSKILGYVCTY